MYHEEKWLREPDPKEIEAAMASLLQEAVTDQLADEPLDGISDWEETPEHKKAVVTLPKVYYDNLAKKRKKRNKTAAKSRKANRGK